MGVLYAAHGTSGTRSSPVRLMLTRALAATALLGLLAVLPAGASDVLRPLRTPTPPVIDGDLDDAVWQRRRR